MTTPADETAVEEAFEAYLAGRTVPSVGADLACFADAVRASATQPGRPSDALAELLATGLLTDLSSSSARTTRSAPSGRRRRTRMFLPALFAKLASAGLLTKAATVAGVAVVGLATAGFSGHLPDPAQHTFATVVDFATPLTAPDPDAPAAGDGTTNTDGTTDTAGTTTTGGATGATDTGTDGGTVPQHPDNFGSQVSQDARDGGVDGQQISQEAHDRNQQRKSGTVATSPSPSEPTEAGDSTGDSTGDDAGTTTSGDTVTPAHSGGSSSGPGHGKSGH